MTSPPTTSACSHGAGRDHLIRHAHRVHESGTGRAEIEAPRVDRADLRLQRARGARKNRVRRRRADDDEADVLRRETGLLNRLPRPPAPPGRTCPGPVRRCAARECRSAAGSTRCSSRPVSRDRRSSAAVGGTYVASPAIFTGRTAFTTNVPFLGPSGRNTRTRARSPPGRATCDRGSRSESDTARRCPRSRPSLRRSPRPGCSARPDRR